MSEKKNVREKVIVIIPAFNEELAIANVIDQVKRLGFDVLVINDGSKDKTETVARNRGAIVLNHLINRGQGAALRTGIAYALTHGADIIVHFDADNQHSPEDIHRLIDPILKKELDVTLGSRERKELHWNIWQHVRFLCSKFVDQLFTGISLTDVHNGLRAMNRSAAEKIFITQDRMAHATEIVSEIGRNKLRFREIPVTIQYTSYSRTHSTNKNFLKSGLEIVKDLVVKKLIQ